MHQILLVAKVLILAAFAVPVVPIWLALQGRPVWLVLETWFVGLVLLVVLMMDKPKHGRS
jgi:hypothetical protein